MLMTLVTLLHFGISPKHDWLTFGIPFLFIMPGVTVIAPLYGILAVMHGSPYMLKVYSTMNVMAVWFNYPLTLIPMLYLRQPLFYILIIVALIVNKVIISVFGSKVRSLLHNPDFELNK